MIPVYVFIALSVLMFLIVLILCIEYSKVKKQKTVFSLKKQKAGGICFILMFVFIAVFVSAEMNFKRTEVLSEKDLISDEIDLKDMDVYREKAKGQKAVTKEEKEELLVEGVKDYDKDICLKYRDSLYNRTKIPATKIISLVENVDQSADVVIVKRALMNESNGIFSRISVGYKVSFGKE